MPANTGSCTYDARSGALGSTVYDIQASENGNPITEHMGHVYGYDTAGRESSDQSTYGTTVATSQRSYDAENHVIQQTLPVNYVSINPTFSEDSPPTNQYAQTNAYVWAADGQLAQRINTLVDNGTFTTTLTYGWDGNALLYQYDGSSLSYYIEKLGTTDTTGKLTVFDRDYSDTAVQSHNTTGLSARNDDPSQRSCETKLCQKYNPNGGSPGYQSYMPALTAVRTDGYSDGLNVFQGVRAYDPNSAQWTAPDAYAGDVHDPMSQKPYMWNRNNPLSYQDPSGYCPWCGRLELLLRTLLTPMPLDDDSMHRPAGMPAGWTEETSAKGNGGDGVNQGTPTTTCVTCRGIQTAPINRNENPITPSSGMVET